jgi:hypothetical protein
MKNTGAERNEAERLLTTYIGDAGQAAALHVTNKISAQSARWIEQNVAFHECSERPHVPCPGCLAEKHLREYESPSRSKARHSQRHSSRNNEGPRLTSQDRERA